MSKKCRYISFLPLMSSSLHLFESKIKNKIYDINELKIFDDFIKGFFTVNARIPNSMKNKHYHKLNNDLGHSLIALVENCKRQNTELIDSLTTILTDKFALWENYITNNTRVELAICSSQNLYNHLTSLIDISKSRIIAYASIDGIEPETYHNEYPIVTKNQLSSLDCDYIFCFDQKTNMITQFSLDTTILNYLSYANTFAGFNSPEFSRQFYEFLLTPKKLDGIITGLSYSLYGIIPSKLNRQFYNLAAPGQDIFYDYEMFKYALSFPEIENSIQYALIGLSYYSFHYDLSKSVNGYRTQYYYPITKTMHHFHSQQEAIKTYELCQQTYKKILYPDHELRFYEMKKDNINNAINWTKEYVFENFSEEEKQAELITIKKDFNKNYLMTSEENKQILINYLALLKQRQIKPIIVVCPTTKVYQECCPKKMKDEFLNTIRELQKSFDFQFLDYFDSDDFTYTDYSDASHLNTNGGEKLTALLNKHIIW